MRKVFINVWNYNWLVNITSQYNNRRIYPHTFEVSALTITKAKGPESRKMTDEPMIKMPEQHDLLISVKIDVEE